VVLGVQPECRVIKAQQVQWAHKVSAVHSVRQDRKEFRVTKVTKDQWVNLDRKAIKVHKVRKATRVNAEYLDRLAIKATRETRD
jgi:hypothetical protein